MAYQTVFKRYEMKYLLSKKQKEQLVDAMEPYMALDQYGHSTIRNIYYDTNTYRLIRHSLEKPVYKEKLRIRSYERASENSPVFVELKKKYSSVVYKRRIVMHEQEAVRWLGGQNPCPVQGQISKEIDYFLHFYETLHPTVGISYEREAFYSTGGDDLRVTFDENILYRENDLSLASEIYGTPLLYDDQLLMEVKTPGGIPLWMTHFLTIQRIWETSFSKYGNAYVDMQVNEKGGKRYA